jgi:hypothetical protein
LISEFIIDWFTLEAAKAFFVYDVQVRSLSRYSANSRFVLEAQLIAIDWLDAGQRERARGDCDRGPDSR